MSKTNNSRKINENELNSVQLICLIYEFIMTKYLTKVCETPVMDGIKGKFLVKNVDEEGNRFSELID
ncbi:CLUMA_CG021641, isoform A [Clunio marinus]|uniref:CLUMA_CG021641, isoform A n=1 Tax=Clunio marinus TaxID=568069 RepID=A0A1J1J8L6_9DIPT|nr:CLUMA_CG021641, isoform A [Clunio marinus]